MWEFRNLSSKLHKNLALINLEHILGVVFYTSIQFNVSIKNFIDNFLQQIKMEFKPNSQIRSNFLVSFVNALAFF